MKLRLPSLQHFFLHDYVDNLIYRAEIRMNWKGRLRWDSPVIQGHFLMWMVGGAMALSWWLLGIGAALLLSFGFMVLATLGGYYVAFWLGYRSLWRERHASTIEMLCLTLIPDEELMDGKFYGALAPYKEIRRYLLLHVVFIAGAAYTIWRDPFAVLTFVAALAILFNHLNFSYYMGALAGLHAAQLRAGSMLGAMISESEYTVILPEGGLFLKTFWAFLILFVGTAFVVWLGLQQYPWLLVIPFFVFPMQMYGELQNMQHFAHDRLKRQFKKKMVFD